MKHIHYHNGKFVHEKNLLITPRDMGFARGYAVFDFFRTYNGRRPFMFDLHIDRLISSGLAIGLHMPWAKDELKDIVIATLNQNDQHKEYAVRVTVSGGVPGPGMAVMSPTLIVMVDDILSFDDSMYEKGVKVITVNHQRENAIAKTVNYTEAIRSAVRLAPESADELLYTYEGQVFEGAFSNFFIVKDNQILTADKDVLNGITRHIIINVLKPTLAVVPQAIKVEDLKTASEAFISVSGKGIVPVVKVDDLIIGDGHVGPATKDLMKQLSMFIEAGKW